MASATIGLVPGIGQPDRLRAVKLAAEPARRIGPLSIDASGRTVSHDDGRTSRVEPRAMKLLVALLRAPGTVFSRDDLFESCWDGRLVSDDAVDQALARLRRALSPVADDLIRIETVTKVGYRLDLAVPEIVTTLAPKPARKRRWLVRMLPTLLVAALGATALLWRPAPPRAPTIAVAAAEDQARELADGIATDLRRLSGARGRELALVSASEDPDFLVNVRTQRTGDRERADISISGRGGFDLIWSASAERLLPEGAGLRLQLAAKVGAVLLCGKETTGAATPLPAAALSSYFAACSSESVDQQLVTLLRQTAEQAPDFAPAWARLAAAEARLQGALRFDRGAGPEVRALERSALEHLGRARSLGSDHPAIFLAEESLLPAERWAERLALLERGLAAHPDAPLLHAARARVLFAVGRPSQAVGAAERSAEFDPLSLESRALFVAVLAHAGNLGRARRELEEAERLWPGATLLPRFSIELRYGDARLAQALLDSGAASMSGPARRSRSESALMRARLDPTPRNVAEIISLASDDAGPESIPLRIQNLGQFGAVDEIYRVVEQPQVIDHLRRATEVMFRPHLANMRNDRRFMALAAQLGLLAYWRESDLWPDFCSDSRLPYNCREEARRLLPGS